jgi:SOS-response transcriptional repressor LexA
MNKIIAPLLIKVNSNARCRDNSYALHCLAMKKSKDNPANQAAAEAWQMEDAERLKAIWKRYKELTGDSQEKFGQEFDIGSQGMMWQYMSCKRALNLPALLNFCRGFSTKLDIKPEDISPRLASLLRGIEITPEMPPNSHIADSGKLSRVPVVGKGRGGVTDRIFTDEGRPVGGHDQYADIYSSDENALVVPVEGDSMSPKYVDGGYALVEPNTAPHVGDDVLVRLKAGGVMIKVLASSSKTTIRLSSYNNNIELIYKPEEIEWMYYVAYPVPARKIKNRI